MFARIATSLFPLLWACRIHLLDGIVTGYFTEDRARKWRVKTERRWIKFGERARRTKKCKSDDVIYRFGVIFLKSSKIQAASQDR